jgi:hypothetical protein
MPLYAVIARENFPMHVIGTVFGAATYGLLYIGSFGMGLGAVAIMLTFRPTMPAERGALAPAT